MKPVCFAGILLLIFLYASCEFREWEPTPTTITIHNLPSNLFPEGTMLYIGYELTNSERYEKFFARGNGTIDSAGTAAMILHYPTGTPYNYTGYDYNGVSPIQIGTIYILKDVRAEELLFKTERIDIKEKNGDITLNFLIDFSPM